ncbi:MAG: hypothetical protein V8Q84_03335 [Bilophila sp.]
MKTKIFQEPELVRQPQAQVHTPYDVKSPIRTTGGICVRPAPS